jgi:multidrug efflux pump subunit AcrA (membrane-fusion protein)
MKQNQIIKGVRRTELLKALLVLFFVIAAVNYCGLLSYSHAADANRHEVKLEDRPVYFEAVGVLTPKTVTTLSSKVMGMITAFNKREGEEVSSSEVILTIDDAEINADMAALEAGIAEIASNKIELEKNLALAETGKSAAAAQLDLASSTYQRIKTLYQSKTIAVQEFEKAEAAYKMASSKMNEAKAQIEVTISKRAQIEAKEKQIMANIQKMNRMKQYTIVNSPIDGRITARQTEVGMLASPGMPLVTVEDYKNMLFSAVIPEQIINNIKLGDKVKVIVDVVEDQVFVGDVTEIAPTGDVMTHTFKVKIALAHDARLKSGMYARGLFEKEIVKKISVPSDFIVKRGQLFMVYTSENDFKYVRPGSVYNNLTEILSGLNPGDVIIKK